MPSEHRQIVFSVEEIIAALVILNTESGFLPRGKIASVEIADRAGAILANVSIQRKGSTRPRDQSVAAEALGAALIRLCHAERIPLPRNAVKRLVRSGDGLALHLDLNAAQVPLKSSASKAALEANARAIY